MIRTVMKIAALAVIALAVFIATPAAWLCNQQQQEG